VRILVTGSNGFVGKNLKESSLLDYGKNVICWSNSKMANLTSWNETKTLVNTFGPDVIIHLAADVGGIKYNIKNQIPLLTDNALMSINLMNAAYLFSPKTRVIGCLSTCIYPEVMNTNLYPLREEYIEDGRPQPSNEGYAVGKRVLYSLIKLYNQEKGCNHIGLIPSNLYGPHDDFNVESGHYVSVLINKIITKKTMLKNGWRNSDATDIQCFGDGTQLRQFTYVKDLCEVIHRMILKPEVKGFFNVATTENITTKEIAERINKSIGDKRIRFDFVDKSLSGQYRKDVSTRALEEVIGQRYLNWTSLEKGAKLTYNSLTVEA